MLPRICFFALVFLCCNALSAQVKFKDPLTDLWGLKKGDSIILPAQYDKIKTWKTGKDTCSCFVKGFLIKKYSHYGIADLNGKILLPPTYSDIDDQCRNGCLTRVTLGNKVGYINDSMRLVIPLRLYSNDFTEPDRRMVNRNDSCWLENAQGAILIPKRTGRLSLMSDSTGKYYFFQSGSVAALFNRDGQVMIAEQTDLEKTYYHYLIGKRNGKYGVFTLSGKEHIPFIYDQIRIFQLSWYYCYYTGGHCGLMSLDGKKVCEARFDSVAAANSSHEYFTTCLNGKYGLYSFKGKEIIPPLYDEALDADQFENRKYVVVKRQGKCGIILANGRQSVPCLYDEISEPEYPSEDSLLKIVQNGKEGRMRFNGTVTVKPLYDNLTRSVYFPAYYFAAKNGLHGIITSNGRVTVPCIYEEFSFREDHRGSYKVKLNGEEGFIDVYGNYKVKDAARTRSVRERYLAPDWPYRSFPGHFPLNEPQIIVPDSLSPEDSLHHDTVSYLPPVTTDFFRRRPVLSLSYSEMPAGFELIDSLRNNAVCFGVKNANGKIIIPPAYTGTQMMEHAFVFEKNKAQYFFDTLGRLKTVFPQTEVKENDGEQLVLSSGGKFFVTDSRGRIIVPKMYDDVRRITDSVYLVQSGNLFGLCNRRGVMVLPVVYQAIYLVPELKISGLPDSVSAQCFVLRKNPAESPNKRRYGLAGANGKLLVSPVYEKIQHHWDHASEFFRNGNGYSITATGKELPPQSIVSPMVKMKYAFVKDVEYPEQYYFSQGYFFAGRGGKNGIISYFDSIVVPFVFDTIYQYNERSCVFGNAGKWGLADGSDRIVLAAQFDSIISRNVLIDDSLNPCHIYHPCEKMQHVIVFRNGLCGVYDAEGKEIIPVEYDSCLLQRSFFKQPSNGQTEKLPSTILRKNGKWYLPDVYGHVHDLPIIGIEKLAAYGSDYPVWKR